MTKSEKNVLNELSKEQLIYLLDQQYRSLFLISEVCVSESKWHIDAKEAVKRIRDYIYHMPSMSDTKELQTYIDMKMEKITVAEYRKIMGFD